MFCRSLYYIHFTAEIKKGDRIFMNWKMFSKSEAYQNVI